MGINPLNTNMKIQAFLLISIILHLGPKQTRIWKHYWNFVPNTLNDTEICHLHPKTYSIWAPHPNPPPNNKLPLTKEFSPHFSSWIVERGKCEGMWKSPHARNGNTLPVTCHLFSRGVIFTHARILVTLLSLRENGDYSQSNRNCEWNVNIPFYLLHACPKVTKFELQIHVEERGKVIKGQLYYSYIRDDTIPHFLQ